MIDRLRRALLRQAMATAALVSISARAVGLINTPDSKAAPPPDSQQEIDVVVGRAHELLTALNAPDVISFLKDWPSTSARRPVVPSSIPVLRWLQPMQAQAEKFSASFVEGLVTGASLLSWRRGYKESDVGAEFLDNYGWTEFVGLTGALPSERLACGVLLLGPHQTYPPHRHEADEIYVPVVGTAAWKDGTAPWRDRPPGAVIHHARYEPHAMRTGASPMLALYLWRSDNLAQHAILDPPSPAT